MRIAVAATPAVAIPTLNALLDSEHVLALIITQPDRPAGRGLQLQESDVSQWAAAKAIHTFKPETSEQLLPLLADVDVLLTIGYGVLLPSEVINAPTYGSLNLHFSLLPRWRGAAPVQRAIEAGDSLSGVTVFALDEGMDTGPIYSVKKFALDSDITSDELFNELADVGVEAVMETLAAIEAGRKPTAQKSEGATRAYKLQKSEGELDWQASAEEVSRKIRAFTSNPGAWTTFRGLTMKIESPTFNEMKIEPGLIVQEGKKVNVGTGTTSLTIGFCTPAGKQRMDSASWINGARLNPGEKFG
ncbi:MAG: methionyl-tRNA formyltransferase [Actinomycetota bacterium]